MVGFSYTSGIPIPAIYQQDGLMNITGISAHDGPPIWSTDYSAFGDRLIGATGVNPGNIGYTGRELDSSGLYYYRARYYDPSTGRFDSEDPLGFAAGINFYAYVGNNPVNGNDPSGEAPGWVRVIGTGVGAVIGGGTSFATQLYQNGGDLSKVNLNNVGWSAATGGAAGFLLTTPAGLSKAGVSLIGAVTNLLNYGATTPVSDWTVTGASLAAGSGAVGGRIGGTAPNPYIFINPSPLLNDVNLIGQMVTPKVLGMGTLGGLVGATDYTTYLQTPSSPALAPAIPSGGTSLNGGSFMDMVNSNSAAAAGGFLIYPNKPNLNQLQGVYSKSN